MPVSRVLKNKTAEEIQHPTALIFEAGGQVYPILPMPDGILVSVTKEIGQVASLLMAASTKSQERLAAVKARQAAGEAVPEDEIKAAGFRVSDVTFEDMTQMLPAIIQALLPNATKIIAASLRQTPAWVEDTLFYRDRLRALRLILEAEDIALLLGEWTALAGSLTTPSPEPEPTI